MARSPDDAPDLPDRNARLIEVANVRELYSLLPTVESGTTLELQQGVYQLDKPIHFARNGLKNIAIRGATGNYDDVVIRGVGMNNQSVHHGILADGVDGLVIADVTIGWVGYHPIALSGTCRRIQIHHCRLIDAGEQFIKASSDGREGGADDGVVEYCVLEYSKSGPPNGYTNGVDVHGGDNWVIRHNLFRNIRTPRGAKYKFVPAVLMWNGAKNTICEANTFVNCDRAIAFGLVRREDFADHQGGIIRNNFIYALGSEVPNLDTGIFVASAGTKVLHNSILLNGGYENAIEARWADTTDVAVHGNVTDARIVARDGAMITLVDNLTDASKTSFRNANEGDLHLANQATRLIKRHPDCQSDWDGMKRSEARTAVGADAIAH